MFILIPGVLLFVVGMIGWLIVKREVRMKQLEDCSNAWYLSQWVLWLGVITLITATFANFAAITFDKGSTFEYKKLVEVRQIYVDRSDVIATEFKLYLGKLYPDFEAGIFDKIGPKSLTLYFAKYPELKSIEAVKTLTEEIKSLQDSIWQQDLEIAELKRSVRFRRVNPWIFTGFFPPLFEWAE